MKQQTAQYQSSYTPQNNSVSVLNVGSNHLQTAQMNGDSVVMKMQLDGRSELVREEEKPAVEDRLPSVYTFQQFLKDYGFQISIVDGWFGKQTEQEVRDFQAEYNIPVTGTVNMLTAQTMDQARRDKEVQLDPDLLGVAMDTSATLIDAMSSEGLTTMVPLPKKPIPPSVAAKIVQEFLLDNYTDLYKASADGWYGNQSGEAIRRFKVMHNLSNDKVVDKSTAELIDSQRGNGAQSGQNSSNTHNSGNQSSGNFNGNDYLGEFPSFGSLLTESSSLPYAMAMEFVSELKPVDRYAPRPMCAKIAQRILTNLGLYRDTIDGWYGNGSANSTKEFQRRYNLDVTGVITRDLAHFMESKKNDPLPASSTPVYNTPGNNNPSNPTEYETSNTQIADIITEINKLKARFQSPEGRAMYDQFFNYTGSMVEGVPSGEFLRNYVSKNGTRSEYASESRVGMGFVDSFIQEGHLETMSASELSMFKRAISQLGSFYGKPDASNNLNWIPDGGIANGSNFMEQTDTQVGKWDCSAYADYVQDPNNQVWTPNSYSIVHGRENINNRRIQLDINWTPEQFKQNVPIGSALAGNDGSSGHVIMLLGYFNNGEALISEAGGSRNFLDAERHSIQLILNGDSRLQRRPMTNALLPM